MLRLYLLFLPLLLLSCTSGTSAIVRSFGLATGTAQETAVPTAPGIDYLRVSNGDSTAYLALGYVEPGETGNTEIWYSAKGEVLKLHNGRIIGTVGLSTDWREVKLPKLPPWSRIGHSALRYERSRDVMPDYRFSLTETITLRAIAPPRTSHLQNWKASELHWFEEIISSSPRNLTDVAPSLYAVDISNGKETVIYGETCLTPTLCLAWQRLSRVSHH